MLSGDYEPGALTLLCDPDVLLSGQNCDDVNGPDALLASKEHMLRQADPTVANHTIGERAIFFPRDTLDIESQSISVLPERGEKTDSHQDENDPKERFHFA